MLVPTWAQSISYWLHMLATVVWMGGLAALGILFLPAARQVLDEAQFTDLLDKIQHRLDPIGWFCLILLTGTGLIQMSANPNYSGVLAIENSWSLVILVKHVVFLMMAVLSAYLTWGLLPQLRRLSLARRLDQETASGKTDQLVKKEITLVRLNLGLGILVLLLTAIARAS